MTKKNSELEKFKDHFDGTLAVIFWLWKNKYVFTVMGTVWATCAGIIINYALIPMAKPIVRPIIKNQWKAMVLPYDSTVNNFNTRLINLEQAVFPEAE